MKNTVCLLMLALLSASASHAQTPAPAPDAAPRRFTASEMEAARTGAPFRAFAAWLEAFNSGDRERLRQFLEASWPSGRLDREMSLRDASGGFELRALEDATPTRVTGLIQERESDTFGRFELVLESADSPQIQSLNRRIIPRPADFPIPHMSEGEIIAALRARLDKEAAADRFAGTVLLARKGKTLFSGAYGLADRETKLPNTLDTRFRIGSMNKMFTGTSVMQLVQAGKIDLHAPLEKYLPDYPNKDLASKVTIHQLLTHTGGTGDIFGPLFDDLRLEIRTLGDYVELYGNRELLFEPGSRWQYSNYGMVLLGVIIEKVSGQSYYEYVEQHVYKPARMKLSGSEPEEVRVKGRSIGYRRAPDGAWKPNTDTLPYRGTSAGGGYSTVGDLKNFADALLANKLLRPENTQLLITGKVEGGGGKYAYGFDDLRKDGKGSVGHGGGAFGMNGMLRIFPGSGYVVVVLSNLDPPAAQRISSFLEARLEN